MDESPDSSSAIGSIGGRRWCGDRTSSVSYCFRLLSLSSDITDNTGSEVEDSGNTKRPGSTTADESCRPDKWLCLADDVVDGDGVRLSGRLILKLQLFLRLLLYNDDVSGRLCLETPVSALCVDRVKA